VMSLRRASPDDGGALPVATYRYMYRLRYIYMIYGIMYNIMEIQD
jgi:hypothetical protein